MTADTIADAAINERPLIVSGSALKAQSSSHKLRHIENVSLVAAIVVCLFFLVTSILISNRRMFWFDEIFTAYLAQLSSPGAVWKISLQAVDTMTPMFTLLEQASVHLLHPLTLALRLPSALAVVIGLWISFDTTRRLSSNFYGLAALGLLATSFVVYFGYEARAYSFYFLFSAIALWCWLNLDRSRTRSAILIGICFLLGQWSHYYFFLCFVPYFLNEAFDWRPWRMPSKALIAAGLGIVLGVFSLWKPMRGLHEYSASFWAVPKFDVLKAAYTELLPQGLFFVVLILVLALIGTNTRIQNVLKPMSKAERLCWLFLLIPVAEFLLAKYVTNAMHSRYVIGALPGFAVGFGCLLWRVFASKPLCTIALLLLMLGSGIKHQAYRISHPEQDEPLLMQTAAKDILGIESKLRAEHKSFFVHGDPLVFLQVDYYTKFKGSHSFLAALDRSFERSSTAFSLKKFNIIRPISLWRWQDLEQNAESVALIMPTDEMIQALHKAGYLVSLRYISPITVAYLSRSAPR